MVKKVEWFKKDNCDLELRVNVLEQASRMCNTVKFKVPQTYAKRINDVTKDGAEYALSSHVTPSSLSSLFRMRPVKWKLNFL